MKELSVLLVDGDSTFALSVARCLQAVRGVHVHVLSRSSRVPLRFSRGCSSFRSWPGLQRPGAVRELARVAHRLNVDVCVAADLPSIRVLAEQPTDAARVPLAPLPSPASLEIAADKWAFASFLGQADLPHPATILCDGTTEFETTIRGFAFPVLLKPRTGSNGIGIERFEDADTLMSHVRSKPGLIGRHIVQSVVDGEDIDCSVLCKNGEILAYTIQRACTTRNSFRPPCGIEFADDPRVLHVVRRLAKALDWTGVAHADLRINRRTGAVTLIELNPRFWGSVLGSLHAGVNFPYLACLVGAGRPIESPAFRECRYVSGSGAVEQWIRGRLDVAFSDTVFRYVLSDPWPSVAEAVLGRS